ncbi:MAG: GntR family transcriptional regulator [Pararhodobacter sp.]|nr:GntR family transcriptional regulator [Pararhodobacter sp.]
MSASAQSVDSFPTRRFSRENGPLYQQLVEELKHLIASGQLEVGSDLPKEAEIGEHLGVSLITVRRALKELEDLGMVQKRSAKPALVTARSPTIRGGHRFNTYRDIVELNRGARLENLVYGPEKGALVERYFGLAKGEKGYCLRAHLIMRNQSRTLVTTYLSPEIGSRMTVEDFSDSIIFRNVRRCTGVRFERALVTARAAIARETEARELNIPPGSPVMTKEMVFLCDRQRTVQVTVTVDAAENFLLSYEIPLQDFTASEPG